jgi:hypothetical protein
MAYQLHVSRAAFYAENAGQRIGIDEWLAAVETDAALTLEQGADDHAASLSSATSVEERIVWDDGNLVCSYPSEAAYAKLLELAERFDAQVQGDDGEYYLTPNDYPRQVSVNAPTSQAAGGSTSLMQRDRAWRWLGVAVVVMAILAANLLDWW